MKRIRRNKAFTLIELMVVILIIAMLATFVAPNVMSKLRRAKADLAKPKMAVIENALKSFEFDCGRLPDESEGGLEALTAAEAPPGLEESAPRPLGQSVRLCAGRPVQSGQFRPDQLRGGRPGRRRGRGCGYRQ
jgi:prepilin-type N-terminal cleavage/methylation domain-containing protein